MISEFADGLNSPFIVPVAGTIMILGIVAVSKWHEYGARKLQSEERMAMIAKGLPLPPSLEVPEPRRQINRVLRRLNVRSTGIILLSAGVGAALFFIVLSYILRERDVLSGAAVAIVPLAIGAGFLIDARIQARELAENPPGNGFPPEARF